MAVYGARIRKDILGSLLAVCENGGRASGTYDVRVPFKCTDRSSTCQRHCGPYNVSDASSEHGRSVLIATRQVT